jgi:hypothetical protein
MHTILTHTVTDHTLMGTIPIRITATTAAITATRIGVGAEDTTAIEDTATAEDMDIVAATASAADTVTGEIMVIGAAVLPADEAVSVAMQVAVATSVEAVTADAVNND